MYSVITQLTINCKINSSISISPFLATYGYKPASPVPIASNVYAEEYYPNAPETLAKNYVKHMKDIIKLCKAAITAATLN